MLRYLGWVLRSLRKDLRLRNYVGIFEKVQNQLRQLLKIVPNRLGLNGFQIRDVKVGAAVARALDGQTTEVLEAAATRVGLESFTLREPELEPASGANQHLLISSRYDTRVAKLLKIQRHHSLKVEFSEPMLSISHSTEYRIPLIGLTLWSSVRRSDFDLGDNNYDAKAQFQLTGLGLRELARLGMIDFRPYLQHFGTAVTDPTIPVVMYLPEVGLRSEFLGQRQFMPFAGITNERGWLGCALSQVGLAEIALRNRLSSLTIIEDDADLSEDWRSRWQVGRAMVEEGEIHVASGTILDMPALPKEWVIQEPEPGCRLFVSNAFASNLFTVLGKDILGWIALFPMTASNPNTEAIDRYMASMPALRNGIYSPPLATPNRDSKSTLWGFTNRTYEAQIKHATGLIEHAAGVR